MRPLPTAAFEHFADPFAVLKECVRVVRPGGLIFLTSSVWAHPYGSHMQFFTKVPWVQYLFSEKTIMTVRKKYRNDGAMRFEDVPGGLNKVGIASFRRMVKALDLELPYLKLNAIKQLDVLTKIPYVNELFTNMFIAVMRKRDVLTLFHRLELWHAQLPCTGARSAVPRRWDHSSSAPSYGPGVPCRLPVPDPRGAR